MKKLVYISIVSVCISLIYGCALFDFDGNGRFDPLEYLSNSDISVAWVDADGTAYQMDLVDIGVELAAQWVQAETGYRFDLAEQQDGTIGIRIRDPEGIEVWIIPGAIAPLPTG